MVTFLKKIQAKFKSFYYYLFDNAFLKDVQMRHTENRLCIQNSSSYESLINISIGIIRDPFGVHEHIVAACREMKISYKIYDIFSSDWFENIISDSTCKAFMIAPRYYNTAWQNLYDERLKTIVDSGKIIYPSYEELWLYESKRRMSYWLKRHAVETPKTDIFYSYTEALEYARSCNLPIVTKTDAGFSAAGVRILRKRSDVVKHVKRCFNKGIKLSMGGYNPLIENGFVLFQEYISDADEWRLIRIGDSFFAHQKVKKGDFHSGTKGKRWIKPDRNLLDFAKRLTDTGGFSSMDIDVFVTRDNKILVNELQTLFGSKRSYQMVLNGKPGRYVYNTETSAWIFEQGDFCQNKCFNLRIQDLLGSLGYFAPMPPGNPDKIVSQEDIAISIQDYNVTP